jgi:hypothetical protein
MIIMPLYSLKKLIKSLNVLIDKMKNEGINGTTINQKIQQYIGYPLRGYGDKEDYEFKRDAYILFVMLQ